MAAQPAPFEYKNGLLLDAIGTPVSFENRSNLRMIAAAFTAIECIVESKNLDIERAAEDAVAAQAGVEELELNPGAQAVISRYVEDCPTIYDYF